MRPSLRFLAIVAFGWAGVRAANLGALPGAEIFQIDRSEAKPPPIIPTQFPPIQPVEPATSAVAVPDLRQASFDYAAMPTRTVAIPVYYIPTPVSQPHSATLTELLSYPRP